MLHQQQSVRSQAQPMFLAQLYPQIEQLQIQQHQYQHQPLHPHPTNAAALPQYQVQRTHVSSHQQNPLTTAHQAAPHHRREHSAATNTTARSPQSSFIMLPQSTSGHVGSANMPLPFGFGTPSLSAASRVNVSMAAATVIRPPIVIRPPGSARMGPATLISSPSLPQMPLASNMRPILIAAGPPSIIKNPLRTKVLLERPVPRIQIKQRRNLLLADFWGEDTDVTKDGRIVNISERAKISMEWRRRMPKRTGIVVGIDFGNTCTGVSYAHQNDGEMIDVVKWPKHLNAYAKVPTVSLYKTNDDKAFVSWGSSALSSYKRCRANHVLMRDYKLQLFDQGACGRLEHGLHLTDVFTQYIRSIHRHVIEEVNKSQVLSAESVPMHYCITIPQAWTLPTRELVLRCYIEAGIILQTPASNLTVITEAEAAATFCREHCVEFESLKDGDIFMICDAGGLTTHVTAFRVDDSLGVRQFVRLSSSHAENCGSVMLDRKFKDLVLQRLAGFNLDAKPQRQKALETLLESFDEIKFQFDANSKDEIKHILVPMGLDMNELDPPPSWMEDEYMSLSGEILCRDVFDPVIERIEELVQEQSKVHAVCVCLFLVGGFGANKYLYRKLCQSSMVSDGVQSNAGGGLIKKVVMVQKAELAVARGAVIYGLKSAAQQAKAFL